MEKPFILIQAPIATRSGYGAHARDICIELLKSNKYFVKIVSRRWGNTPMNALRNDQKDHQLLINALQNDNHLPRQPDLHIDITVPNEFQKVGVKNMGITAGLETTAIPKGWIDGLDQMDLNIVPSTFVADVCRNTQYEEKRDDKVVGSIKTKAKIVDLFEGYDEKIYGKTNEFSKSLVDEMSVIKEDFCFLFVGHWLSGNMGEDRKDVGMMIKTFLESFKNLRSKKKPPALILKTSSATTSVIDREEIKFKIECIQQGMEKTKSLPNIYLLHGDLEDTEMNDLYNHPKVKAHLSFTHGEGFGRPLLEASLSGKPILFSKWSGHLDFLPKTMHTALEGTMVNTPKSAFPKEFYVEGMGWFAVNYSKAKAKMKDVFYNYSKYKPIAQQLAKSNSTKFTRSKMGEKLIEIIDELLDDIPKEVQLKLPKKNELPKLKKI